MNGLMLNSVAHAVVTNNVIHDPQSDILRITGSSNDIKVTANYLLDTHAVPGDHPDMIQFFGANGHTPTNIQIIGNVLYDNPATGSTPAQGVFISDPGAGGYKNILVEDNLINSDSANGIYVNGGTSNVVVNANVMATWPNGGGASIRVVEKAGMSNGGTIIEHNIARHILNETTKLSTGLTITGNKIETVKMADLLGNWDHYVDASFGAVPHPPFAMSVHDLLAY
jgi:hypothetical protein